MSRRLAAAALVLALVLGAGCSGADRTAGPTWGEVLAVRGLVVAPLSGWQRTRLSQADRGALPWSLLRRPAALARRFEIDEHTEFYAFFSPKDGRAGQAVVFTWFSHGKPWQRFSRPQRRKLTDWGRFPRPLAVVGIWGQPSAITRAAARLGGPSGAMSQADWRDSRGVGPRRLVVSTPEGRELASIEINIFPRGVRVY